MREEILSAAAKRKLFFAPDALEMILSNDHPMEFTNTVFSSNSGAPSRLLRSIIYASSVLALMERPAATADSTMVLTRPWNL